MKKSQWYWQNDMKAEITLTISYETTEPVELLPCKHTWVRRHAPDDPELETVVWCDECGIHKAEFDNPTDAMHPSKMILANDASEIFRWGSDMCQGVVGDYEVVGASVEIKKGQC